MLPYRSSGAREANQLTDAWPQLMNKTCLDLGSLVPKTLAVVVLEQDLRTRERERVDYLRGPCTPCMVAAEPVLWGRQFLLRSWRRVCGSPSRRRRRCAGMTAGGRDARWSPRHGFDRGGDGDEGRSDSNQGGSNYSALKPISGEMWARANTANVGSHAGPSPLFM